MNTLQRFSKPTGDDLHHRPQLLRNSAASRSGVLKQMIRHEKSDDHGMLPDERDVRLDRRANHVVDRSMFLLGKIVTCADSHINAPSFAATAPFKPALSPK